jgi:hypothetical protein
MLLAGIMRFSPESGPNPAARARRSDRQEQELEVDKAGTARWQVPKKNVDKGTKDLTGNLKI